MYNKYSFEYYILFRLKLSRKKMDFSNKFLIIQNALNLSQKDLALKLGLSTNAISQYITGKRKPDFNTIQKLIDLGISPLFIFSDGKDPISIS